MARIKSVAEVAETEAPPQSSTPSLPPYRSEAIAALTAKARALHAEMAENTAKADAVQYRNAAIRRELASIDVQIREHAWNGEPLP